ncbi:MAG: UDP-2,3-diacylglucosamine diphosphatase [Proteobacteria bacterium]|nr:UDP-2,3-diacylglucosamine diphosphatase [Pseudomonadota bacterium]
MRIIFFSDAHLNKKDDGRTGFLVRFINDVCQDADMLVIVGDLFEFYHGYDGYIYPWYKEVIDALKTTAAKGKRVYFIEGNHEFHMGSFFETYTGIKCMDELTIDIDNKKFLITHGYQIKRNYLVKALKTPFIYGIMDMFGPVLTWKIAAISGAFLSRKTKPFIKNVMDLFRQFALKKFDDGYDAVILAHSHIPDKMEYNSENTKKYYLNTGDIIKSSTYVEYNTETGFEIKKYS